MEGAGTARARTAAARVPGGFGQRLRVYRERAGLTQKQLAGDRYTGAYISALENGLVRASMAALMYLADRLDVTVEQILVDQTPRWDRLEADLQLASGDWPTAIDQYTALLERTSSRTDAAQLLRGRAEAYCRLGKATEAIADATRAQQDLKRAGLDADAAYAAYWLANAHYQLDNPAEAKAIAHQVLAEVRAGLSVQTDFTVRLLVALAAIESWEGRHDHALPLLKEARAVDAELDDRARAAMLFSLAIGYAETGDHEAALRAGTQALGLYEAAGATHEAGNLRNNLALSYLHAGNVTHAAEMANESRELVTRLGDNRLLAHVAETQAQIALVRDDEPAVTRYVNEALDLARSTGNTNAQSAALVTLARLHRQHDRPADAESAYRSAIDLLRQHGPRPRLSSTLRELADLLVIANRHKDAVSLLREALDAPVPPHSQVDPPPA
jgi:tetratricopeptide (TPR) repeat protein